VTVIGRCAAGRNSGHYDGLWLLGSAPARGPKGETLKRMIFRRTPLATVAVLAVSAMAAAPAMATTLYVTPRGHNDKSCALTKPCKTISFAVSKAARGSTVAVAKGTYKDSVKVTKDITLVGVGSPVINAKGKENGVLLTGAKADGAALTGFTVENANDEGILATQTSRVTISENTVRNNDKGIAAKPQTGECATVQDVPGDCGEGLHLMTVSDSRLTDNTVKDNLGGILMTDELGPTNGNVVAFNKALNNVGDCGITLAGHNTTAYANGAPQPTKSGVYDNIVIFNTANNNGTKGQGGGILAAAGPPGSAVYDNTVQNNTANGNGLGGFTLHSHAPGQYFNDNRIIDNTFLNDGIAGNTGNTPGDSDAGITKTAGIIVWSAVTPIQGTVITGNTLGDEYYGIWTQNVPPISPNANTFLSGVTVPVFQK
jgi:nitrous oxidase accessory protein NosD